MAAAQRVNVINAVGGLSEVASTSVIHSFSQSTNSFGGLIVWGVRPFEAEGRACAEVGESKPGH